METFVNETDDTGGSLKRQPLLVLQNVGILFLVYHQMPNSNPKTIATKTIVTTLISPFFLDFTDKEDIRMNVEGADLYYFCQTVKS